MSTDISPDIDLLDRYLAGELSPSDAVRVETWLAQRPDTEHGLRLFMDALPSRESRRRESQASWDGLRRRLEPLERPASRRASWGRWRSVAVTTTVLCAVLGGVFWRNITHHTPADPVREYATALAQYATLHLPDGSRILMAPESRIRWRGSESGGRIVELKGQAHFVVTPDARRSFTVHAGDVRVQVLGTAFEVQHEKAASGIRVAVTEGKVAAFAHSRRGASPYTMTAGMAATFSDSLVVTSSVEQTSSAVAWASGRLVFTDASVAELLAAAGKWYGYEFRLADSSLATRSVTTALAIDEPAKALRMLGDLLNVDMVVDQRIVTLRPRRIRNGFEKRERHPLDQIVRGSQSVALEKR